MFVFTSLLLTLVPPFHLLVLSRQTPRTHGAFSERDMPSIAHVILLNLSRRADDAEGVEEAATDNSIHFPSDEKRAAFNVIGLPVAHHQARDRMHVASCVDGRRPCFHFRNTV